MLKITLSEKQAEHVEWAVGELDANSGYNPDNPEDVRRLMWELDDSEDNVRARLQREDAVLVEGRTLVLPDPDSMANEVVSEIGYRLMSHLPDIAKYDHNRTGITVAARNAWNKIRKAWEAAGGSVDMRVVLNNPE